MGTSYTAKGKAKGIFSKLFDHDKQSDSHPQTQSTYPDLPTSDDLTHRFDILDIDSGQQPSHPEPFVGGFQPYRPEPSHPASYPTPGPLPRPPHMTMPMPQPNIHASHSAPSGSSLTMQHALNGTDLAPYPPQQTHHKPSASTSYLPTPNYAFSPAPSPLSSPTKPPPSKKPAATAASSVTPTKPKRQRASSDVAGTSKPPVTPGDGQQRCDGQTKAGNRCTRVVKVGPALAGQLDDEDLERFCFQHSKEILSGPSGFYARKNGQWLSFDDWIPTYLQVETQLALRVEMEKARSMSDVPGYIYAYEIRDPATPSTIKLKVGRAVNLTKRIDQWAKQCKSKEQVLRGWYPGVVVPDDGSGPIADGAVTLMKGRVQAGEKGECCHRLERLIHLELADLISSGVYLDSAWPNTTVDAATTVTTKKATNPGNKKCSDCGQIHKEIFEFKRVKKGRNVNREWESIVKPIVEKWGGFVDSYL